MLKRKKVSVLTIGSSNSVKGGITTVIEQFLNYSWDSIDMSFLPTYIEGGKIKQMFFFCVAIWKYLFVLLFDRPDIVHVHMSYKGSFIRKFIMVKMSKVFKVKTILHLHGSEFKIFYENSNTAVQRCIKQLFESVDQTIVLGQSWFEFIQNIAPKSRITICNNAIDIPIEIANLNKGEFNILFLAVLLKRKGIYDLVDVVRNLKDERFFEHKNIKFIIAGDGPEYQNLVDYVQKYKLESLIDIIGWIDSTQKQKLLKNSQLLVLPSYNEGLPMAILEAMSYGIPIISTDVGSISEVVIPRKTGYLISPGNVGQLKSAIKEVTENKECWRTLSINAKNLIVNSYNKEKYLNNFQKIYINLNDN